MIPPTDHERQELAERFLVGQVWSGAAALPWSGRRRIVAKENVWPWRICWENASSTMASTCWQLPEAFAAWAKNAILEVPP